MAPGVKIHQMFQVILPIMFLNRRWQTILLGSTNYFLLYFVCIDASRKYGDLKRIYADGASLNMKSTFIWANYKLCLVLTISTMSSVITHTITLSFGIMIQVFGSDFTFNLSLSNSAYIFTACNGTLNDKSRSAGSSLTKSRSSNCKPIKPVSLLPT